MQLELIRDAEGQPAAIRVRVGGFGLMSGARALAGRLWRRLPAMPRALVHGSRLLGAGLRAAVPAVEVRRDPAGRLAALVVRLGQAPVAETVAARRPIAARIQRALGSATEALRPFTPQFALNRDARGHASALRIRFGGPDISAEVEPIIDRRTLKWVIEPSGTGLLSKLQEFWRYRRMLWFFCVKGVQRLYKGMNLGIFWLFARPLLPIAISTLIFGRLLNVPSDNVPYFLFFLAGSTSWMLFEQSLLWVTRSLDMNKGLIKKVYFPRLIVPMSAVAPAVAQAGVYSGLLLASAIYYLVREGRWYLRLDPGLVVALLSASASIIFAVAIGLWTTIWQLKFREVRFTLRYVLRFWNYLTPVLYPLSQVPLEYRWIIFINPMASLVESFKWGVLGVGEPNLTATVSGLCVIGVMLAGGIWYFSRAEATSVDTL